MSLPASFNLNIRLPSNCYKPASKLFPAFPSSLSITNSQKYECPTFLFPPANQSVAAIVFGDGSHSQLYPLTKRIAEGAIPISGNYKLIDAVVSNCINSSITKIYALTQFNFTSLNSHLSRAYAGAHLGKEGFVEVIAAYQSPEDQDWFQGTADAIRRCLWVLEEYPVVEFLVLPGYHLYKMDYQKLIEAHRSSKANITVSVLSSSRDEDLGLGIFEVNAQNQVIDFRENPEMDSLKFMSEKNSVKFNDIAHHNFPSMGIYVINKNVMRQLLKEYFPFANNLRSEVIPGAISLGMKICAYKFDGYWENMRSIGAYYRANMESTRKTNNAYSFYAIDSPVYTLPRSLPPTLITDAVITDSVIGDGCILRKCTIDGTVLGMRTRVGEGAIIEDSVIMGSDTYQIGAREERGLCIPVGIGEGSHIRKAIIDKNARIGQNVLIINRDNVQEANNEESGYIITGGIVIILRSAVIQDGSII
ncbi:inactive glucose-1-phosphate adenylyltransferase small subunit 2, chloroplastic [Olea europaea subsp. europaea]|uniref:Inactive glucose-1-phosphate adenylyltransferase small subunit 2, chloroplastic n=2 Tax=Olea europaea subsp. europaea TaxID=158383 RepID=A0A8S0SJV3_OLEEU|nr:inactive glucose-1-phosphate adenylyltransferase small subunit 2, chloroplastic [Olea europaea subsp. europaea]